VDGVVAVIGRASSNLEHQPQAASIPALPNRSAGLRNALAKKSESSGDRRVNSSGSSGDLGGGERRIAPPVTPPLTGGHLAT
jgi:hypothetical protein